MTLVDKLRRFIADLPPGPLPSASALAARLACTPYRARNALRALRDEGLVEFTRGSAIHRRGREIPRECPVQEPSVDRVHRSLRQRIADGVFSNGEPLPPLQQLALMHGISSRTALAVYRRLHAEGLAGRAGKRYVAGGVRGGATWQQSDRVILVIQRDEFVWRDLCISTRTAPFCRRFVNEAQVSGIQIMFFLARMPRWGFERILPSGPAGLDRLISSLGKRYTGSLIVGQSWTYWESEEQPDGFTPWLSRLVSYGKPVAWWDIVDQVGRRDSPAFSKSYPALMNKPGFRNYFRRVYSDQQDAAECVVRALFTKGHKRAAVVSGPLKNRDWCAYRVSALLQAAARMPSPGIALVQPDSAQSFSEEDARLLSLAGLGPHAGTGAFRSTRAFSDSDMEEMFGRTMDLAHRTFSFVLERQGCTAVICVNDDIARLGGYWAREQGIEIPRRLSLVSFDADHGRLYPFGFSSCDMGFAQLAASAIGFLLCPYHTSTAKGRTGISVPPRLDHFGSIASGSDSNSL